MYEDLVIDMQNQGICMIDMNFHGKCKGLYADNIIAISINLETKKEKQCILAEELGHYYTSVGNILDKSNISNAKQEKRARDWGYEKLVSIIDIINAFNAGVTSRFEMAEYLNVTEEFLDASINHYEEKYGAFYLIDKYLINFEPYLEIIEKEK